MKIHSMNLSDLPAYELIDLIRRREVAASEALEAALERIQAVDGRPGTIGGDEPAVLEPEDEQRVHAFITLTAERTAPISTI